MKKAKQLKKRGLLSSVWSTECSIYVKINEDSLPLRVKFEEQLPNFNNVHFQPPSKSLQDEETLPNIGNLRKRNLQIGSLGTSGNNPNNINTKRKTASTAEISKDANQQKPKFQSIPSSYS